MTPELTVLALAALLQVAHWTLLAAAGSRELGSRVTLGPRDRVPELSVRLGRIYRAFHNGYEALILFGIAVGVTVLSGQGNGLTAACAWVFLGARILYVPAYLMGLVPWRSVVWVVGLAATTLMIVAALV